MNLMPSPPRSSLAQPPPKPETTEPVYKPRRLELHERLWAWSRALHQRGWRRSARVCKGLNFLLHHALLPPEAVVGEDVRLDHYALGVVMHPNVVIGNRVRIFHGVTFAATAPIGSGINICIGDDVMIGAGAIIIARANQGLTIGAGAAIGAGSVVTHDVEPGATYVGEAASKLE